MLNLFENEGYSGLLNSISDIVFQMKDRREISLQLEQMIAQIGKSLDFFSRFKNAIDQSIIIAATDEFGRIVYANDKFFRISQYSREELIGKTHKIINSGYHDKGFFKEMWSSLKRGEIWEGDIKNRAKDGSCYWVKSTIVPLCNENNKPYMYISLRTDITKEKENEERLVSALKNDFNMVVSAMHNFVFKVTRVENGDFIYIFGGGKLASQLKLDTKHICQKSPKDLFPEGIVGLLEQNYEKAFGGQTVTYHYSYGGRHLLTTLSPICENGQIVNLIGSSNDITELNRAKEEIEFLAYHDPLTRLPNRRKFKEDIHKLIGKSEKFSLFILDLDRFKFVNDSLGHTYGDELLKAVTRQLKMVIGTRGYLYRFAGDEFIILSPSLTDNESLKNYANILLDIFKGKFQLFNGVEVYITGSIGIGIFPDHGDNLDTLFKNADSAMYGAKETGKNEFKIYDQKMMQANEQYLQMESYLQAAIDNEELELFFQPKLNIKNNRINSMEALLRWNHPILGNVPPDVFIPLAEETGLIWQIDEWVLKNACIQNKKWNNPDLTNPLRMAVNISAIQFSSPNFVMMVEKILAETGLSPELLELEITETAIIENSAECLNNIKKLRELGIYISIDDFGTGYTSLNYLKKFDFDYLKIDQSYIKEILKNKEDMVIVKTIISLAHDLQLKVIAEGVEDENILEYLKQLGCDEIQGYFVSHPLPNAEFEKMLETIPPILINT